MGTWSAGITGNDTALDMIEEYKVAFSYFDVSTGLQKLDQFVRSNFDESDEDEWCAYFYSLADFMWKNGILTDEIRDKAVQMVDSDFGMETWREAGSEKQRRKELAKFRERITSPQCAPKKIKISHIHPDDIFEDGEVIAIQLKTSGKKYMPNYPCDPIPDEEFLSYDNKYVIIQKAYSKEQHFSGVMPELCDRTAVFVLFKGIYDSPEDVDITKLEKADFKCDDSVLVSFFEHESSLFHFKKRGYKIIGKIDPVTGEVVPTNRHQKRKATAVVQPSVSAETGSPDDEIIVDRTRILELEKQVAKLQKQKESLLKELDLLVTKYRD